MSASSSSLRFEGYRWLNCSTVMFESMRTIWIFAGWTERALWSVSGPKLPMKDLNAGSYCCNVCAPVYPSSAYVVPL